MTAPHLERVDGVPIVHVREDIDAASATRLGAKLEDALDPDATTLIADLGEVRYLDSAGIDMLLRLGQRVQQRRAQLLLVIPAASRLQRLVEIVGLRDAVDVYDTVAMALGAVAPGEARPAPEPEPEPEPEPNGSAVG